MLPCPLSSFLPLTSARSLTVGQIRPRRRLRVWGFDLSLTTMEGQQGWKMRLSFKNATILVCFLNLLAAFFLLQSFFAVPKRRSAGDHHIDPAQLKYIFESEEIRHALEPLELIKRVKEIEQESYSGSDSSAQTLVKQTAAVDLSKRLKDLRVMNEANNQKALEEWRKRKMERTRQREIEKNVTVAS